MTLILDYAWARPSPATIKAAGYSGVMRYLSPDASKNLSPGERDALLSAGLSIGLVWESFAARAGQGFAAGAVDANAAEAQADALGYPTTAVLFYACDYDANPSAVTPYFAGVMSAARRPVGVYGSARVVEGVNVPYMWQACAWSGGRVSTVAHLYQRLQATVPNPIASTDENIVLHNFPMWTNAPDRPGTPPASRTDTRPPLPTPTGGLIVRTIDLRNASSTSPVRAPGVTPLQRLLGIGADGIAGDHTRWALGEQQRVHGIAVDFIFGPQSASAFLSQ